MAKVKCKFGKLKRPSGKRICRRVRRSGGRRCAKGIVKSGPRKGKCKRVRRSWKKLTKAQQESAMWKAYRAGKL